MRLTFLGATRMVTGSSYLLEVGEQKILIDCGMFQGSKAVTELNHRDFLYNPADIDCVLLTHAHIDHSGLLPKLCNAGFKGTIYATKVTKELCGIMLPDSAHIQEFDAEIANRKGQRAGKKPVVPLYTVDDAYRCLEHFAAVQYNTELTIGDHLTICFRDAGHILGSSFVEVVVKENGETTKLLFSGDLGQPNQPILKDPTVIESADYIIIESTYGDRLHEHYDKEEKLAEIINGCVERGGNVIIPSFAVGRTQALLYHLSQLSKAGRIPPIPVIIDSPLAISATDIFLHNTDDFDAEAQAVFQQCDGATPLCLPQLRFTKTSEESKALNTLEEPAIIISASGMADAGRILHHLKHNLWRPESSVLFVGYQAQGSLGRRLIEGAKRVKILGEEISVKATIHNLDGFSAHADKEQLLHWLGQVKEKPANIFLVHGEVDMAEPLGEHIKAALGLSSYIPHFADTAVIAGRQWQIESADIAVISPAVKQLQDYLDAMEREYAAYRKAMVDAVQGDNKQLPEVMRRLEKFQRYMRKTLKNGF